VACGSDRIGRRNDGITIENVRQNYVARGRVIIIVVTFRDVFAR